MEQRDFDRLAETWDNEPRRQLLSAHIAAGINVSVDLGKKTRLLDYGCGTGLVAMHLLPLVGQLTGLDSSSGMLSVFERKIPEADRQRVTLQVLNLADGGAFCGAFDVIIAAMLLHHVDDTCALIHNLTQHLTPGGFLCLADLDTEDGSFHDDPTGVRHHGFSRQDITSWMSASGLSPVSTTTVSTIEKFSPDGTPRSYPVFLSVSQK